MRPPLYTDRLSPEDRSTVRWWYARIITVYSVMILLVLAIVLARHELIASSENATQCGAPTDSGQANNAGPQPRIKAHALLRAGCH